MILNRGNFEYNRVLEESSIDLMLKDHTDGL